MTGINAVIERIMSKWEYLIITSLISMLPSIAYSMGFGDGQAKTIAGFQGVVLLACFEMEIVKFWISRNDLKKPTGGKRTKKEILFYIIFYAILLAQYLFVTYLTPSLISLSYFPIAIICIALFHAAIKPLRPLAWQKSGKIKRTIFSILFFLPPILLVLHGIHIWEGVGMSETSFISIVDQFLIQWKFFLQKDLTWDSVLSIFDGDRIKLIFWMLLISLCAILFLYNFSLYVFRVTIKNQEIG
jgi:hypothetical protein